MGIPEHLVLLGNQFRDSSEIGYKYSKLQQLVFSAATSTWRQESAVSNLWTSLINIRDKLRLRSGWRRRAARSSINQRDSYNIHWGLDARAHGGGGICNAFGFWNLISTMFSGPVRGRVKRKEQRTLRYTSRKQVGRCSSCARNEM